MRPKCGFAKDRLPRRKLPTGARPGNRTAISDQLSSTMFNYVQLVAFRLEITEICQQIGTPAGVENSGLSFPMQPDGT